MEENNNLMEDNMSTDRGMRTIQVYEGRELEEGHNKYVNANGIKVCYDDLGASVVPIIFIHGFPFDKSMWKPQMDFFKKTHRVIAYDIRGYGKSGAGNDIKNMSLYATDLIKFMDALEISSAIVCGLSMGGYILFNAENRYRSRFRALILCDTQCIADSPELKEKRNTTVAQIIAGKTNEFAEGLIKNIFCKETIETKPDLVEEVKNIILNTAPDTLTGGLKALAQRWDMCNSLEEIYVPTLILCGRKDTLTPVAESELLHRHIPHSTLHIIENAAHLSNLEQPDAFNLRLSCFAEDLPN